MKPTVVLSIFVISVFILAGGCTTPVPATDDIPEPASAQSADAIATLDARVSAVETDVADVVSTVELCCRPGSGDPAGHVLESIEDTPNATPNIGAASRVTLYSVPNLLPDVPGVPHDDLTNCYTLESRATAGRPGWEAVPTADLAVIGPPMVVPDAELTPSANTGVTPPFNPLDTNPVTGAYGWYAPPGCYFVSVVRDGERHTSPVVGVLAGNANDIRDLHFCWQSTHWGSNVNSVCTLLPGP